MNLYRFLSKWLFLVLFVVSCNQPPDFGATVQVTGTSQFVQESTSQPSSSVLVPQTPNTRIPESVTPTNVITTTLTVTRLDVVPAQVTETATSLPEPVSLFPGDSYSPTISGDGRFVAFASNAGDLVTEAVGQCPAPDSRQQNCTNIYVYDRQEQQMQLVSRSSDGAPANGNSREPKIAADGRWLVFTSEAANLDKSRPFQFSGVFLHDMQNGTTQLISDRNASRSPSISADGRFVAFAAMDDVGWNVYVYDRISEEIERVSLDYRGQSADGDSIEPRISADGNWVAFWSWAGDLVADDTEVCRDQESRNYSCGDVFLFERSTGNIQRLEAGAGYGIGMGAFPLSLSGDGQWLTFADLIYNRLENEVDPLVCNQRQGCGGAILSGNGQWWAYADGPDVYVVNRLNDEAELVSVSDEGTSGNGDIVDFIFAVEGGGFEPGFDLSENGRWVVFSANATNLAAKTRPTCDDAFLGSHHCYEVFVRDRELGVTEWISKPFAEN